jgi:hypothetical protein
MYPDQETTTRNMFRPCGLIHLIYSYVIMVVSHGIVLNVMSGNLIEYTIPGILIGVSTKWVLSPHPRADSRPLLSLGGWCGGVYTV